MDNFDTPRVTCDLPDDLGALGTLSTGLRRHAAERAGGQGFGGAMPVRCDVAALEDHNWLALEQTDVCIRCGIYAGQDLEEQMLIEEKQDELLRHRSD